MAMSPGFCRKTKTTPLIQTCAKRKRNINGGTWNDEGMEGGNRLYAGSFWHQVRKKPELWSDKSITNTNTKRIFMSQPIDIMLSLFKKKKISKLQQWVFDNQQQNADGILQAMKMLIAYSAAFVPLKPKMKAEYAQKFYNDRTIGEMAIALLFQYDLFLFSVKDKERESKINKGIDYYCQVFRPVFQDTDVLALIQDRFHCYGQKIDSSNEFITDIREYLASLTIETQERGAFQLHRTDDFIMLSHDFMNNTLFRNHVNNYLDHTFEQISLLYKTP
jgi:hypothetical protein